MAAMLQKSNNKRYLHKNVFSTKENHSFVLLLQYGRHEHTLYKKYVEQP